MRYILLMVVMASSTGWAEERSADPNEQPQVRAVGRLNVNTASREQLLKVPGLDETAADQLLRLRARAPIADLHAARLSDEAAVHLKTDGESNFYRLRQLPLRQLDDTTVSRR
jgi:hypothetical protein